MNKNYTGVHQNLSAVCPLTLRKDKEKQGNLIILSCRQIAILRGFQQIVKS